MIHDFAIDLLRDAGFTILTQNYEFKALGVEVNVVAMDQTGTKWYCEVTGAYGSKRPGLERTDTVRKILGSGQLLARAGFVPFIIITTDIPTPNQRGDLMMRSAGPKTIFDVIVISSRDDRERLKIYSEGQRRQPLPGWWKIHEIEGALPLQFAVEYEAESDRSAVQGHWPRQALSHSLRVMVPTRARNGHAIDAILRTTFVRDLTQWCCQRNGGLFRQSADGSWLDETGQVIEEPLDVVESWGSSPVSEDELSPFLRRLFEDFDQDAVSYIVDGKMTVVQEPAWSKRMGRRSSLVSEPDDIAPRT